jgi:AbrB family looped-hinge helix DNA binding protein
MDKEEGLDESFLGSVTVGERGQVVIPSEAREEMGLEAGDKLLAFAHPTGQMVCLCKVTMLQRVAEFLNRVENE